MKKEVLIAILIGLTFGLIITYGVYRMRLALTRDSTNVSVETSPVPSPSTTATTISILHPEDGIIQAEKELTVTGTSTPDSYVVLFVNNEDYISTADQTGSFSFNVILNSGGNVLKVHAVSSDGTTTVLERTVIVQELTTSPSSTPSASPKAN